MNSPEENRTGVEMLDQLAVIREAQGVEGLTPDAADALNTAYNGVVAALTEGAEYAIALSEQTGVTFYNPLAERMGATTDITAEQSETLTEEEQAYKETVLEQLKTSFGSYQGVMEAINGSSDRENDEAKLPIATEAEAQAALEAVLTPAMIRAEIAQIAEFSTNPEANSPRPGFDTVFIPNADLTATDETAVAAYLQRLIPVYQGEDGAYLYPPLHNQETAHKADVGNAANVTAVRVPRHLNVRGGTVAEQKAAVKAHNDPKQNPDATYVLEMADDLAALSHIALLVARGDIDTTNPDYDEGRFWATYYKDVLAKPQDGVVPDVYVDGDGQVFRDRSDVYFDVPSRALVVPKV